MARSKPERVRVTIEPVCRKEPDTFEAAFLGADGSEARGLGLALPAGKVGTWEITATAADIVPTGGGVHGHTCGDAANALIEDPNFKLNPASRHEQARRVGRYDFASPARVHIQAHACALVKRVDLICSNRCLRSWLPDELDIDVACVDERPLREGAYLRPPATDRRGICVEYAGVGDLCRGRRGA